MKKIITLALALMMALSLAACGQTQTSQPEEKPVIGVLESNSLETDARNHLKEDDKLTLGTDGYSFQRFPSLNAMLMELNAGRLEVLTIPNSVGNYLVAKDSALHLFTGNVVNHYHMAARESDAALCDELSNAFDALKANGTLDKLVADYITGSGEPAANTLTKYEGGETHTVAVTGDLPPLDYVAADGSPAGFNVALLNAIAEQTGCNFEVIQMEASARLTALESEKVDLIFWLDCMGDEHFEPKAEGISLTAPYYEETRCFVSTSKEIVDQIAKETAE